jgi:Transposase DDE domain
MKKQILIKKFKDLFKLILKEIYVNAPFLRKRKCGAKKKFNDDIYINWISKVLFSGISWRNLSLFLTKKEDPCFNSIRNKFNEWNNIGAFYLTYMTLLEKYHQKNKSNFKQIFMDSTDIVNDNYFKEGAGYNKHKIANKLALKFTVITTKDRVPIAFSLTSANRGDVKMLEKTVDNSNINLNSSYHNPTYLTCDKGYISAPIAKELKKNNIIVNTPRRKNMKIKNNTIKRKDLLKERFSVESFFSTFKRSYKRLNMIREKNTNSLVGWIHFAFAMQIIRVF